MHEPERHEGQNILYTVPGSGRSSLVATIDPGLLGGHHLWHSLHHTSSDFAKIDKHFSKYHMKLRNKSAFIKKCKAIFADLNEEKTMF